MKLSLSGEEGDFSAWTGTVGTPSTATLECYFCGKQFPIEDAVKLDDERIFHSRECLENYLLEQSDRADRMDME